MRKNTPFDKKIILPTAALALLSAIFLPFFARTVRAEEPLRLERGDFSLALPDSYQQYLSLTTVSDLAVKDENIAVADGRELYIYNGESYLSYTHDATIEQTEFADDVLYFLDSGMSLYAVDYTADALSPVRQSCNCTSFTYANGELYYANLNSIYRLGDKTPIAEGVSDYPRIAYHNDTLYYTVANRLFVCNDNVTKKYTLDRSLTDIQLDGNTLYACNENGFYSYDLASESTIGTGTMLASADSDLFFKLALEKGNVYLSVRTDVGAKIKQFNLFDGKFTDYEIGASSSAENRLIDAQNSIAVEGLLVLADFNRILVKEGTMSAFKSIPLSFTPRQIATNGSSVLVSGGSKTELYDLTGNKLSDLGNRAAVGIACGKDSDYYLAMGNSTYYRYSVKEDTLSEPFYLNTTFKELTADVYGNLYILDTNGSVYRYTPEELENEVAAKLYRSLPSNSRSLRVDRCGEVYALSDNSLIRSRGNTLERYLLNAKTLFNATTTPVSIALNESTGTLSLVYKNYILNSDSDKLSLPALTKMDTSDAYRQIYQTERPLSLLKIAPHTLQIPFDVGQLKEQSAYFASQTFVRQHNARGATLLAELTIDSIDYYALCPLDGSSAVLVLQKDCSPVEASDLMRPADGFTDDVGYLSNHTYLYKFPYIDSTLSHKQLDKSTAVQINGYFEGENNAAFYYVTHEGVTGFVPASYVQKLNTAIGETDLLRFTTVRCAADTVATATDGKTVILQAGKDYTVGILSRDKGIAYIAYSVNGKTYYAQLPESAVQEKDSSYVRYFLVVILLLADLLILGNYVYKRRSEENPLY